MDDELLQAVQANDIERVAKLRKSIDKDSRDRRLVLAASLGFDRIVQYFWWDGVSIDVQHDALLKAAQKGHQQAARVLCQGARWDCCNEALLIATGKGHDEVVKQIGHRAERKTKDKALVIAASNNFIETVRYLAHAASLEAQNETLLVAARKGYKVLQHKFFMLHIKPQRTRRLYTPHLGATSKLSTYFWWT